MFKLEEGNENARRQSADADGLYFLDCHCAAHRRRLLSPASSSLFIYFIEEERGQSLQSFALLMSNSAFPQSADLAGQSGFGVCRGKPRRLPDILMGKLASLIWLADVVCHWVSITCHSTLMPLDRADQTMSFDLRSTLKADRERDGERKRKGGGRGGQDTEGCK